MRKEENVADTEALAGDTRLVFSSCFHGSLEFDFPRVMLMSCYLSVGYVHSDPKCIWLNTSGGARAGGYDF